MSQFEVTVTERDMKPGTEGVSNCKCISAPIAGPAVGSPGPGRRDPEATPGTGRSPLSDD